MKRDSTGALDVALPTSGLAEELIPLLQRKLGLGMEPSAAAPENSLLAFAAKLGAVEERAVETAWLQLVTFAIGVEEYGVPIERVQEILRVSPITRVPGAPSVVRGVVNVRGRLLAVVDMRNRLGLGLSELGPESRIVMADFAGRFIGLLVDRVSYVIKVPAPAVETPPSVLMGERTDLVAGVVLHDQRTILVLDLDRAVLAPGVDVT